MLSQQADHHKTEENMVEKGQKQCIDQTLRFGKGRVLSFRKFRQAWQTTVRKQKINPFKDERIHTDPLIER